MPEENRDAARGYIGEALRLIADLRDASLSEAIAAAQVHALLAIAVLIDELG